MVPPTCPCPSGSGSGTLPAVHALVCVLVGLLTAAAVLAAATVLRSPPVAAHPSHPPAPLHPPLPSALAAAPQRRAFAAPPAYGTAADAAAPSRQAGQWPALPPAAQPLLLPPTLQARPATPPCLLSPPAAAPAWPLTAGAAAAAGASGGGLARTGLVAVDWALPGVDVPLPPLPPLPPAPPVLGSLPAWQDAGAALALPTHPAPLVLLSGLLPPQLGAALAGAAGALLRPSTVMARGGGTAVQRQVRSSRSCFLSAIPGVRDSEWLAALRRRLAAALAAADVAVVEALQLVAYGPGEAYATHHDAWVEAGVLARRRGPGQRVKTLFLYLGRSGGGGGTHFPHLRWASDGTGTAPVTVACQPGAGLAWRNLAPDGLPDPALRHAGLPPLSEKGAVGTKWGLNVWVTTASPPSSPLGGKRQQQ